MKKHLLIFLLITINFAQTSHAEEYYWSNNWHSGEFDTAKQACDDAYERTIANAVGDTAATVTITDRSMTLVDSSKDSMPYSYYAWCNGIWDYEPPPPADPNNWPPRYIKGIGCAYLYGDECPEGVSLNPTTGQCTNDVNKGENCNLRANPIDISIGNKFQQESDYRAAGSSYLIFKRAYNSLDGIWRHSYSTHLRILPHSIAVVFADGRETFFDVNNDSITPIGAEPGSLTKSADGWVYRDVSNQQLSFNSEGKLTDLVSPTGHTSLTYSTENITVSDHLGNSLVITVRPDGQPLRLSMAGIEINYSYDSENRLILVDYQDGTARHYHYNEATYTANTDLPNALTGITDENGTRYATWSYDAEGRAISSEHANGVDKTTLTYNADGTTTVTNPLGKQTTYHFTTIHGVRKVTQVEGHPTASCEGANQAYSYDANGNITSKTDWNGVTTTYTYDLVRNLELSRTEASGTPEARTITTEWHPDYRLPLKITEPGKITEYSYDAQGRQLTRTVRNNP